MNAKRRWYELLLSGIAVLLLSSGILQTANAEYIKGEPEHDHDSYETYEDPGEHNNADSDSNAYGQLTCTVQVECDANGVTGPISTWSYAAAWGDYLIDWTWDGPPENAPGGTLDWSQSGYGNAYAWGNNDVSGGGGAISHAQSESEIHSYDTQNWAYGSGGAWGTVEDNDWGVGTYVPDGIPPDDYKQSHHDREGIGWYSMGIAWQFTPDYLTTIPEGTTYFYFSGGADCDCSASANAGGVADSHADCDSYAYVDLDAEFFPDE